MAATSSPLPSPRRITVMICAAAMVSLAIAMGVGRFAFTPLYPFMVREGLLSDEAGAMVAAGNYLGYLVGALIAARMRAGPATLLIPGLIVTVIATAAMGWTTSVAAWVALRIIAGVMSAWTLVATSAWGLGWLASLGRPHLAGIMFAGVGLGIAMAGLFCLVPAGPAASSLRMWIELGALSGVASVLALATIARLPAPAAPAAAADPREPAPPSAAGTGGLIASYTLFGYGYILPATYLPALARQLVDDPLVFGLAWPLFGTAAGLSTIVVAWALRKADRLDIWALSHLLMAVGVLLPGIRPSLASVSIAALLVGGTFMVVTMVAMQEARARAQENATEVLGRMTAGFAFGQLMGPVSSAAISHHTADFSTALGYALALSASGLLLSAFLLRRMRRRIVLTKEYS